MNRKKKEKKKKSGMSISEKNMNLKESREG